ncbi:MAG: metallophosphoesterase, partial [Saprospiraceae bacterium]|nr:metallophosphoesterase [Saprospiraceae bacterium]
MTLKFTFSSCTGIILLILCGSLISLPAQTPDNAYAVYNIGNVSDVSDMALFADRLSQLFASCQTDWTLLLTGDLIDNRRNFNTAAERLDTLIQKVLADPRGNIVMIPGDRDWQESQRQGLEKVRVLENYLAQKSYDRLYFPLRGGCPGPVFLPLRNDLNLLLLNTQWWNHRYRKPTPESADCDIADEESIREEIEEFIEENATGNLIIAGHHPLYSNGEYGGSFKVLDWFFPVPLVSLFVTSFKQNIGGSLETINEGFVEFRDEMREMLQAHYSVIYASGHEKNVEVIRDEENVYINSGAPSNGGFVR